jgi:hypothetical protein
MAAHPKGVFVAAAATLAAHLATANGYGIFRDEFYYLACADHLAWGYVDHPPLSIALLAVVRAVAGDSALALRVVPGLLHALAVAGTGMLAGRMGARGFGAGVAALCTAIAPGLLGMTSFYSMNAIDLALWVAALLVFAEILRGGGSRCWLLLGVVVGLGLLNKYSMAFLAIGLGVGLLFSRRRADLKSPWPWAAAAIAALLFAPHLVWEAAHDWPTREFVANAQQYKISDLTAGAFLKQVVLEMLPPSIVVWAPGLAALLAWRELRPMRALGVAWLVVLAILLVQQSKPYYMNVAFPIAFAAGGVVWERIGTGRVRTCLRAALVLVLLVAGAAAAPFALPLLPPERFVAYSAALGIESESGENHAMGPLPQHFADRFGWAEMARAVAAVYDALPPEDRSRALIVARNYGEAGALRYYGRALGLPPAVSQHNSFYLWGPGRDDFDVVIAIGQDEEGLRVAFDSVVEAGRSDHPLAMPYERDQPIFVCRGLKLPPDEAWRRGRLYI